MVRRVLAVAPAGLLLWALACASPTLPLPPPEAPTIGMGSDADHVRLMAPCGGAEGDAIIQIINENPNVPPDHYGSVVPATACGSWVAEVWAHKGDPLEISQELGTQTSQTTYIQVP